MRVEDSPYIVEAEKMVLVADEEVWLSAGFWYASAGGGEFGPLCPETLRFATAEDAWHALHETKQSGTFKVNREVFVRMRLEREAHEARRAGP